MPKPLASVSSPMEPSRNASTWRPDGRRIKYMVDYWSDMTTLAHEKWAAYGTADYIAGRLQATGMRRPDPGVAYEAAREYIARECVK